MSDDNRSQGPADPKAIARRFREDLWNTGDLSIADAIIDRECVIHARIPFATDFMRGPDAVAQLVLFYRLAFSEIRVTVDGLVAEGDLVVSRWTARGRNTGDLLGLPPTGRETVTTGIDFLRIAGGRIAEGWVSWDTLSLIEQLVVPAPREREVGEPDPGSGFLPLLARLWEKREESGKP
ncbi:MAG TPA: ester cyclase [Thermoanaerobaculia bacterium]|nr:ester cyclase [Thermoanaerobaculia bacterium]